MNFDVRRLRRGDQIIGISAVLFFIFMFFFHWLGFSTNAGITLSSGANGWHSFTNSRWIWLITIIVALVAVARSAGALRFESPVSMSAVVGVLGALSTLLILYRIIHHPHGSASAGAFHASFGIKVGIWLALLASAGLTYGAYLAMQEEGTSIGGFGQQAKAAFDDLTAQHGGTVAPPPAASEPGPPPQAGPPPPASEPPPVPAPEAAPPAAPPVPPPASEPPPVPPPEAAPPAAPPASEPPPVPPAA